MSRVWDYAGFAIWFAGLGYIVMWLFGSAEQLLPPPLHMLGIAAAISVPLRLAFGIGERRGAHAAFAARTAAPETAPQQEPLRSFPRVKPRSHFGLRGVPH